jgi:hypothetical protein
VTNPFLPVHLTDDDTPDPAAMLADLAAETAPDRPIEVFAGRGKGRVCFLSPSILSAGLPVIQGVLGPGEWRIAVRRADGRLTSAALHFEGRPRPIAFGSPFYIGPDPADLAGTPWGPPEAPPAPPVAAAAPLAGVSGLGELERLAATAQVLRSLVPPAPDLTPLIVALAQRPQAAAPAVDLAGIAALIAAVRPEPAPPQESQIAQILTAAAPLAGPAIGAWIEAKSAAAAPGTLMSFVGPVIAGLMGQDDDGDDDDDDGPEAPAAAPEPAPESPRPRIVRRAAPSTPEG